jgi:opacity protein-like surface antigen
MMKFLVSIGVFFLALPAAFAADRTLDLTPGCKVYLLQKRKWVAVNASRLNGTVLTEKQILRDDSFTVFRIKRKTFGVSRRCLPTGDAEASSVRPHRSAEPAPLRGDTHSPWSAVFSIGYNLSPKGSSKVTFAEEEEKGDVKYTGSLAFLGEGNYRFNAHFRLAGELGISQLSIDSQKGNETSFFDARPEYIFRAGPKFEIYIGPMLGIFFLSQNRDTLDVPSGAHAGATIDIKEQTATAALFGVGGGVDYALNNQFDLGFFLRYYKPGTLKRTGTETFPDSNTYSEELTTSYLNAGLRFAIHF